MLHHLYVYVMSITYIPGFGGDTFVTPSAIPNFEALHAIAYGAAPSTAPSSFVSGARFFYLQIVD